MPYRLKTVDAGRRRVLLSGLLPALLCAGLAVYRPAALARLDLSTYDTVLRLAGTHPPAGRIVIVDVDERSLAAIGQWPWRRDVIGELVARLRAMDARTIAMDMILAEPDRSLPPSGRQTSPDPNARTPPESPDAALADVLRSGRVVVGYALTFGAPTGGQDRCLLHPLRVAFVREPGASDDGPPVFQATDVLCSLPLFMEAAGASGFLNAGPDADGILRRVPLVLELNQRMYPALALAAATATAANHPATAELRIANANTTSLVIGDTIAPLDGKGNLLLRYRGARRTFPYVSAADVLGSQVPADTFKDKIVFVGTTALGTQELVATPFDPSFTGVEIQATVADNLLTGDFIRRPEHAVILEMLTVFSVGIAAALAIGRAGLLWGGMTALGLLIAMWTAAVWLLDSRGVFLSPLLPTCALLASVASGATAWFTNEMGAASRRLERARRQTEAATHAKNEFLMTVSHELWTPLTAIYGYVQMLAKGGLRDDQKARALATIERTARAQTQLINDLLDASQTVTATLRLNVAGVKLADVVRSALDVVKPAVEAKEIALHVALDDLPSIPGDHDRLQQVAWNLVSNAVKFTPDHGRIDVRLERVGTSAELTVADSGVGIAPEFLPYVFEPFRQQDAGTTRRHGGLGLGLALVRHLVELHGGTIDVDSKGEGRGTTFRVRLPLRRGDLGTGLPRAVRFNSHDLEGIRVLIVDEETETRSFLASALLDRGADAITAASATNARAILQANTEDVLVISLDLPDDEGYHLVRSARAMASDRGEQLSVITLGGSGSSGDFARAREAGSGRHLSKPVDTARLASAILALTRSSEDSQE